MYAAVDNVDSSCFETDLNSSLVYKHAAAMSVILATEIFQVRRDAVLATSKISTNAAVQA